MERRCGSSTRHRFTAVYGFRFNAMIEIEMSRDIKEYEPTIVGPFTKRQVICVAIGVCIGYVVTKALPIDDFTILAMVGILFAAPVIACGWIELYGMHLETYVLYIIHNHILTPQKRKYISESYFYTALKEKQKEDKADLPAQQKPKRKIYPKEYRPYD